MTKPASCGAYHRGLSRTGAEREYARRRRYRDRLSFCNTGISEIFSSSKSSQ